MIYWNFGYDGGIVSGFLAMAAFNNKFGSQQLPDGSHILTPTNISVMTAVPAIGNLFALPFAAYAADRLGRKKMVYVASAVSLVAAVLQTAAYEMVMLVVGRTLGCMYPFSRDGRV